MIAIKLSNKDLDFYIDDDDFDRVNTFTWYLSKRGSVEAHMNFGYKINKLVKLHRFLLDVSDTKIQVDHIDGNKLNNTRDNLRLVTNKINSRNRHKKVCGTSSKYFGVTLDNRENLIKRWVAQIKVDYKHIFLGRYEIESDAALAYNIAAEKYGFLTRNLI